MISTLSELMGNSPKTVSNWKKENRPIMIFLHKYFTKEDLQEFLKTGKVSKLESKITNEKNKVILDEINKKQQEIEELKAQLNIL